MPKDLTAVRRLAEQQGGVVTRAQARDMGISDRVQRGHLSSGFWVLRFGCLVIIRAGDPDWRDSWALRLRLGAEGIVSGPTAMRLSGWKVDSTRVIAIQPAHNKFVIRDADVRRDTSPRATRTLEGIQFAAPHDALVDCLMWFRSGEAQDLLDAALQQRWTDPIQLGEAAETRRATGRNGTAQLAQLAVRSQTGTRSHAERQMLPLLAAATSRRWSANCPVVANGRNYVLDFALESLMLCIEVDGRAYHSGASEFENDRRRQNDLVTAGWTVLRFTWEQITKHPEWVIAQIRRAILLAEQRAS